MSTILSTLLKRSRGPVTRNTRIIFSSTNDTKNRKLHTTSCVQNDDPMPFVSKPYSYAYGRSRHELIYQTIGDLLDQRVENETGRPMVVSHHEGIKKTFTEFNEDVNRLAKAMYEDLGLKHGDVVGLWSCNTYDWITIQYAAARLGLILCTINPFYQAQELNYVLRKADVKTLFMPGKKSVQEQINRFQKNLIAAFKIDNEGSSGDQFQLQNIVSIDGGIFSSTELPTGDLGQIKYHTLEKLKENRNSDISRSITGLVSPDDPGIIMFTSGTTGKPKGAFLSQFSLTNNANIAGKNYRNFPQEKLSFCVPLPFFHSFAAVHGCIAMVATPFQLVIPYLKYDVSQIVESINANQVSHLVATPTLVIDLLNYITHHKVGLPSLTSLMAGGASVPIETAHQFMAAVPSCTDFRIGYGATELGPATTGSRSSYTFEQRTETIGTPLDFVEIKLTNPETREIVKIGEAGEIHSRGHNTMLGYWKDPVKTKEAIDAAGWYNTGDLGVMDEEGFLKIIGRTKELIIVGGENVYPREIEELLYTHPAILDVSVIGVPDPRKGEEVCAWIKLKDETKVTEEELKQYCQHKLAYFKVPRYFQFVDGFPVTSVGKAKKFEMREISCKKLGLKENR